MPLFVIFASDYAYIALHNWGDLMDLNRATLNEYELIQLGLSELSYAAPCTNPIAITTQYCSSKSISSPQIQAEQNYCPCHPRQVHVVVHYITYYHKRLAHYI